MYTEDASPASFAEAMWLSEPKSGDFNMGSGTSTQQLQNPNTTLPHASVGASGPIQSPAIWAFVVILLIITKLVAERAGEKSEFATVRIGLENLFVVGAMASIFLYMLKLVAFTFAWVPGSVKQFAGAV